MKRRPLVVAGVWLALAAGSALPSRADELPGLKVSAQQLQRALAERFPLRFPIAGFVDIDLHSPQLRLLPERNRLGSEMAVDAGGQMLRRRYTGKFDVDFLLRYEPSDMTVRAHRIRVHTLRFPGLSRGASELLETWAPALAERSLQEVVLHRLRREDLAVPDSMGLQPGAITVTHHGIVIGFVAKEPR